MRDAVIQNTVGNPMNIDFQAGSPCVVFINGVYKGMLNIRERSNEDNIYSNYDELEDVDMFENWTEFKEGNKDAMDEIRKFVLEEGHTYEEYDERIDIREFMDVHLANFFYNNTDFPGNNIVAWRPQEQGGKWRLILKDTDYGMGLKFGWGKSLPYNFEILNWLHNPNYISDANNWGNTVNATAPFVHMENFPEVREDYINRAIIYLGDFLNSGTTIANIENWYQKIKNEWPYHAQLVGEKNGMTTNSLSENVEYMKEWIKERDVFFPKHFADFYNIGEMAYLEIGQPDTRVQVKYEVNDILLTTGKFKGFYPKGKPIKIEASLDSINCSISGWKINIIKENQHNLRANTDFPDDYLGNSKDALVKKIKENEHSEELIFRRSDSFEFSYPDYATYVSIQPILDTSHLVSDISLSVTAGDNHVPVAGIETRLINDDYIESAVTDKEGKILFEGKEWGFYNIEIADLSYLFLPFSYELFLDGNNTEIININLTERLLNPNKIDYNLVEKESGLYDINLTWEMEEHSFMEEFFGYLYHIEVNGKEIACTNKTSYKLKDIEASNIMISIFGETPYGKFTERIEKVIDKSSFTASIYGIEDNNKVDNKYYNLNGLEVNPQNLMPGIYIQINPKGTSEKIIIR